MAFFKFRLPGQRGVPEASGRAAPTESVEVLRQRARHRLIGAAVLVAIGVVGFPLLFDTQPRPVAVDIPIEIPDRSKVKPLTLPVPAPAPVAKVAPPEPPRAAERPVEKPLAAAAGLGEREQVVSTGSEKKVPQVIAKSEPVAPKKEVIEPPARAEKPAPKAAAVASKAPEKVAEKPVAKAPEKSADKKSADKGTDKASAAKARASDKPVPGVAKVTDDALPREIRAGGDRPVAARDAVRADDGNRARALLEGGVADAAPASAKPADKPKTVVEKPAEKASDKAADAGRYIVQIGAYADALKAREARLKLEGAGLKTYTQVVEGKDGKRIRVRVGPFEHRAAADKAASRIKSLNLPAAVLTL